MSGDMRDILRKQELNKVWRICNKCGEKKSPDNFANKTVCKKCIYAARKDYKKGSESYYMAVAKYAE